jgi:hypothetical protein
MSKIAPRIQALMEDLPPECSAGVYRTCGAELRALIAVARAARADMAEFIGSPEEAQDSPYAATTQRLGRALARLEKASR